MTGGSFCTSSPSDRFATRLLADTDCQAFGLVERGYATLSQSGGTVSTALTGLMVIAVAFFGYRLLLGRGFLLFDALALVIKIGVVLVIATSWESWQAVAYNGLARAPSQVASEMLVGIGVRPPVESLENSLDALTQTTVGYRTRAGIASPWVGGPAAAAMVLNVSAVLLTLATVGLLVATRVVLAILLAIAPAMAGLLLFDSTRGMAQGWLGAMAAAALAPLFILLVAAIEFAILTPMISRLLTEQTAGTFENTSVMPIGLVTVVFGVAMVLALRAGGRIGRGIRLQGIRPSSLVRPEVVSTDRAGERTPDSARTGQPAVARALEDIVRREAPSQPTPIRSFGGSRASATARDPRVVPFNAPTLSAGSPTTIEAPSRWRQTSMSNARRRSRAASRRDV